MLDFLKGKRKGNCIGSPCKGKAVALTEVPDPTFSEKILGDGFAVIPSEGKIYAPADGEVTVVFDTLHAITMTTDQGAELLIHIGLDTVTLKGPPSRHMLLPEIMSKRAIFCWMRIWRRFRKPDCISSLRSWSAIPMNITRSVF